MTQDIPAEEPGPAPPKRVMRCSFCAKSQTEVETLILGPGVAICNECVAHCIPIVDAHKGMTCTLEERLPDHWPTERLLKIIGFSDGAAEAADRSMRDLVDILREREISWAAIGETLGVSRQAAWKRFG